MAQGFVVEFKEHDTDPWHDKVYLETFDTNVMDKLVEGAIVKVGFRHSVREYNGRSYNEVRMNNFELQGAPMESRQPAQQAAQDANASAAGNQPNAPFSQPQNPSNQADDDDLPF